MFSTNTVFYKNVNAVNGVMLTGDGKNKVLIDMYARLAVVCRTINTLMYEFSQGNFYEVANILTLDVYNKMSMRLGSLAADAGKYPDYETLRKVSTTALAGMFKGIRQYAHLVDVEAKLEECKEHEAILYDPVKLQAWIEKMKQRRSLFPESVVTVRKATLKPEYAEYIRLYGFPAGGIFDTDKMNTVLNKLHIYYS